CRSSSSHSFPWPNCSLWWLPHPRGRAARHSALELSGSLDSCQSPYWILGGAAVSGISIGDASRRCGVLDSCYLDVCRIRGTSLFSKTARALGGFCLHWPAKPIRVLNTASHWDAGVLYRFPLRV